ncbi:MAG: hypothetical protein CMN78_05615 [Spirochaetales bacterium]|nr:hypothetical protein [Spirochaetales bacterium]
MSKKNKRLVLISMLLALMPMLVFAGGGQGEAAAETSSNFNATGLPILNEPVTFRVGIIDHWNMPDMNEKQMFKDWREKTNVVFDLIQMSGQEANTKVPLMYSTDDLPDAFINIGASNNNDYGAQELNIPLEDYIAQYAPNVVRVLEEMPVAKKWATATDGHMYHLPYINLANDSRVVYASFIRQQWLESLGMDIPTDLDEFYDLLVAFKTKDPNGNGKADEIPFSVRWQDGISGIRDWFQPFGTTSAFMGAVKIRGGEVFATTLEPGYKDAVKYLHRLYAEELMDPEVFTYEQTSVNELLSPKLNALKKALAYGNY